VFPQSVRFTPFDHAQAVRTLHIVQFIQIIAVNNFEKIEDAINLSGPFRWSIRNSNKVIIERHLKCTSDFTSSVRHYKNISGCICIEKTTCGRILHCREHNEVLTREFLRGRSKTKVTLTRAVDRSPRSLRAHSAFLRSLNRIPPKKSLMGKDQGPPPKRRSLRVLATTVDSLAGCHLIRFALSHSCPCN
jgi:hypothetical protein